ncbi:MAG: hypothetical protein V1820_04805 [archaeon]
MDSRKYTELEELFEELRDADILQTVYNVRASSNDQGGLPQAIAAFKEELAELPAPNPFGILAYAVSGISPEIPACQFFQEIVVLDYLAGELDAIKSGETGQTGFTEEELEGLYALFIENGVALERLRELGSDPSTPSGAYTSCFSNRLDSLHSEILGAYAFPEQQDIYLAAAGKSAEQIFGYVQEIEGRVDASAPKLNILRELAEKTVSDLAGKTGLAWRALQKAAGKIGTAEILSAYDALAQLGYFEKEAAAI